MVNELTTILKRVSIFNDIDDELIAMLADKMTEEHYSKGDVVFTKGDKCRAFYIIKNGGIRIHNGVHTFTTLEQYNFFGEYSLLDEHERSTSATATTDTTLLALSHTNFELISQRHPQLLQKFVIPIIQRLRHFNEIEETLIKKTIEVEHERNNVIKEKEAVEQQRLMLEEQNKSKDKFFTIISHDIKNNFSAIINITDLLLCGLLVPNPERDQEYIKQIGVYSQKTFNLLESLLKWSRMQTGAIKCSPQKININTIIEETIDLQTGLLNEKDIKTTYIANETLYGYADIDMTTFVFRNIMSNAIKFSPQKSTITIKTEEQSDSVCIHISDEGIGMNDDEIANLFKIEKRSLTHNEDCPEKGTGLGLVLCKEFVEKNNGTIWATSFKEKGSTFSFTIPKAI